MSNKLPKPQRLAVANFASMTEEITNLLETESERGAILILSAYIEELLGLIIRAVCVSDTTADKLLQLRRPAGDFDSRILLCEALALIHPDEANALRAVQKIRNSAAHFDRKGRGFDVLFNSQATADQVANLCNSLKLNLSLKSYEPEAIREIFILSTRVLVSRIWIRLCEVYKTGRPKTAATFENIVNASRESIEDTPIGKIISRIEQQAGSGDLDCVIEINNAVKDRLAHLVEEINCKLQNYEKE